MKAGLAGVGGVGGVGSSPHGRLGRCAPSFWLAVAFDAAGLGILLSGVFADVAFADLLIYGGSLGLFLSLLWWVFWFVGNQEVPPALLQDDVGLLRAARPPLGARLRSFSSSFRRSCSYSFTRKFSFVLSRPSSLSRAPGHGHEVAFEMEPV